RLEEDRQRLRRDVEVGRKLGERLPAHARERQREVEARLGERFVVGGGVGRHFFPYRSAAAWRLMAAPSWTVSCTSCYSQASGTPSSCDRAVAALKKFSPRSSRPSPWAFAPALWFRLSASGSLSFSPTKSSMRRASALRTFASPAGEPASE